MGKLHNYPYLIYEFSISKLRIVQPIKMERKMKTKLLHVRGTIVSIYSGTSVFFLFLCYKFINRNTETTKTTVLLQMVNSPGNNSMEAKKMDDENWYGGGYDGGFVGDSKSKKNSIKRPKIPKFRSFIRTNKRGRRRRTHNDSETTILTWTIISLLVSCLFHTETVFILFYGVFLLYTIISKDIRPIKFVSSIIFGIGVVFFIALTFAVLINLLGGANLLKEPITWKAYTYIIGAPYLSRGIVRWLEKWIYNK